MKKEYVIIMQQKDSAMDLSIVKDFYTNINFNENIDAEIFSRGVGIIDYRDQEDILEAARNLREKNKSLPLLILREFGARDSSPLLGVLPGSGQARVLYYKSSEQQQLLAAVQAMLHPEYPSKRTDIAVILPVYNEESRFKHVVNFTHKVKELIEDSFLNLSIFFINDGSTDKTDILVHELTSESIDDLPLIQRQQFLGQRQLTNNTRKAGTYIEAISKIQADILVFADADDSFSVEDIARFINIIQDGYYDMVVGTKDLTAENRSMVRRMMSFAKRILTKNLLPEGVYDSQTGLKAFNALAARYIIGNLHQATELAIDLEMLFLAKKMRFRVLQKPVYCLDREGSHVNIVSDSIAFIKNIVKIPRMNRNIVFEEVQI